MSIHIDHYSDLLCIWAYVSQIRMDELSTEHGSAIAIRYRYFPVFGDAINKLDKNWSERGGREAYNQHVQEIAQQFGHVALADGLWLNNPPASSMPAHLYLSAIQYCEAQQTVAAGSAEQAAWALRKAFFAENQNIAQQSVIEALLEDLKLPIGLLENSIQQGLAWANLSADMQLAKEANIQASPTLLFNEGRQRLTGNVGYRIIDANVRELLEKKVQGQSWC